MPIVKYREATGKLSPLEEDSEQEEGRVRGGSVGGGRGEGKAAMGEKVLLQRGGVGDTSRGTANSGVSIFTTLGSLILTARPYTSSTSPSSLWTKNGVGGGGGGGEGSSLQGEIFQTINKESLLVMQEHMEKLWCHQIPMCIEVRGQATPPSNDSSLLLEQWLIQVLPKRSQPPPIPPSLLTHAVQSFLHFSQIRSWIVSHKGPLLFDLTYRVCAPGEDDSSDQFSLHTPVLHTFPPSSISPLSSLSVTVRHLPRLKHIPRLLTPPSPSSSSFADENGHEVISKFRDLSLSKSAERLRDISVTKPSGSRAANSTHFSKSVESLKDIMVSPGIVGGLRNHLLSKSAERVRDVVNRPSLSSSLSTSSHLLSPTCFIIGGPSFHRRPPSPRSPHTSSSHSLTPSPNHTTTSPPPTTSSSSSSSSAAVSLAQESFPFSPPQPSPMSPKLLAGLGGPFHYCTLLERTSSSGNNKDLLDDERGESAGNGYLLEDSGCSSECSCLNPEVAGDVANRYNREHSCPGSFCFDRLCPKYGGNERREEGRRGGGGGRREGEIKEKNGAQKMVKRGAVRPPSASSPVPFMRRTMSETKHNQHKRSSAVNIKPVRPPRALRSNSVPATMHSLSLLGTFEESVLNGRLEPCGFVEGFTAELGASGSFCPPHITLPVTAAFFNLSDFGTSPYLGVIDLSTTGKRGYHIAKKGTVQLTLFNPNGTVVKIFVVTYDFSDMPPNSQTFLRQKTVSPSLSSLQSPPLLHYLIHLRFLCSRSGRVYLHKDVRLIFARRAPDTEPDFSRVTLTTVTEAPPSPKYGPLDGQLERSKMTGIFRI